MQGTGEQTFNDVVEPATITDFMTMFTREAEGDGVTEGDSALLGPTPLAGLLRLAALTDAILETTNRIGGDTDPLDVDDLDPLLLWPDGEINSTRDDLRVRPDAPDGRARTLIGTVLAVPLGGPPGRASTGCDVVWQLGADVDGAPAVRFPLKMNVSRCCESPAAVLHLEGEIIRPPGTCCVLEGTSAAPPAG